MENSKKAILARLSHIWEPPDFTHFFKNITNRAPHRIKKGTLLFNEGDLLERLYLITDGFVKLYRLSPEGRETTSYLFGPGYVLGLRALTSKDKCARHSAEAMTDLNVFTMSHREYLDFVSNNPEYLVDLLYLFIIRLNYTERRLEGFIVTDAISRIAHFLADFAKRFCKGKKEPITLPLEFTHQRIAEFVGSFRETVTNVISKLEAEKILTIDRGKVVIFDLHALQKIAQGKKKLPHTPVPHVV